jgi:hypothetical protein
VTPPVDGAVVGCEVVWILPAVGGVVVTPGAVVVVEPGDVAVWPAVAGAVVAVPAVCASAHVPASSNVKKNSLRM